MGSPVPTSSLPAGIPHPWRVRRRSRETRDTVSLELEPAAEGAPGFAAGQFSMLSVFGVGEVPISISGDPARGGTLTVTVRAVGGVSRALCRSGVGSLVGVRGPFGRGWGVSDGAGADVVLVAGGIGLAPLRPVLYEVLAHREAYGRVVLLYGARTPEDLLYRRELEGWRGRFDLQVRVTVDAASASWRGGVGVVTSLVPWARFDPASTLALVCGPEVMMRFVIRELGDRGMDASDIRVSMERNMKCAVGLCGHCQFGPFFVCRDGPVFRADEVEPLLRVREI